MVSACEEDDEEHEGEGHLREGQGSEAGDYGGEENLAQGQERWC